MINNNMNSTRSPLDILCRAPAVSLILNPPCVVCCAIVQAYDQHLNMILGDVEEVITSVEVDDETYEEIIKVSVCVDDVDKTCVVCYYLLLQLAQHIGSQRLVGAAQHMLSPLCVTPCC